MFLSLLLPLFVYKMRLKGTFLRVLLELLQVDFCKHF
jgi:hypothetical protein